LNERVPYHVIHQDGTELDIEVPLTLEKQLGSNDPHTVVRARIAICDLFRASYKMHHGHEWRESHNDHIYWEQLRLERQHTPATGRQPTDRG